MLFHSEFVLQVHTREREGHRLSAGVYMLLGRAHLSQGD